MHHSIPYTPQQNGVAERKNISLKEMATLEDLFGEIEIVPTLSQQNIWVLFRI